MWENVVSNEKILRDIDSDKSINLKEVVNIHFAYKKDWALFVFNSRPDKFAS